jgi:hypothetical protein
MGTICNICESTFAGGANGCRIESMNNKNLPIIVAIALPIVFLAVILLVVFLPTFSIKPTYNFIYSADGYVSYGYKNKYDIKDGNLVLSPIPLNSYDKVENRKEAPDLFVYDVKNSSSKKISFEEAKKMTFDAGPSSPDGYNVIYEGGNYGIFELFGSDNSNRGYFISKGKAKKRLEGLTTASNYYYNNDFNLIGWIK